MKKSFLLSLALCLGALQIGSAANAEINEKITPSSGLISQQTLSRLLLVDSVRVSERIVAVGDHGYVIYSDNNGETWLRGKVPSNTPMLNAVYFVDDKTGWAVGHDAVILTTRDKGESWTQAFSAPAEQKPLMDVLFLDAQHGIAVGAYASFYETQDGGKTWVLRKILDDIATNAVANAAPKAALKATGRGGKDANVVADEPTEDRHFNAIVRLSEGRLLIVGEAGTLLVSEDVGKTWRKLVSPYKGSFFGAIQAQNGSVLIYGLRGKIYRADAALKTWALVENASVASLMGSTRLSNGDLVLAGLAGMVLISNNNGQSFRPQPTGITKAYASALAAGNHALMVFGEAGARTVPLTAAAAK